MNDRSFRSTPGEGLPPNGFERRRSPRTQCDGTAEISLSQPYTLIRGKLRDIGAHGCFVATPARVRSALQSSAHLCFHLGEQEYSTSAQVANIRPGEGMGLEFQFTDGLTREVARAMIEKLQQREPEPQLGHHLFHYGNARSDA